MKKLNGWKRVGIIASTIAALGAAGAVVEAYAPWAPRITFVLAADNTMARLDNMLIILQAAEAQAMADKNEHMIRHYRVQIREKLRQIAELVKLKEQNK